MKVSQSRRDFLAGLSAVGTAGLIGARSARADEGPLETTTLRLRHDPSICAAPWFIAEDLLRAEGFTDISYLPAHGPAQAQMLASGELDFGIEFAGSMVSRLDLPVAITVLAGLHTGCFELFAHEPIRTIRDLKGKRVGINALGTGKHIYLAIMVALVGLDPHQDIEWVEGSPISPLQPFPMQLFIDGEVDAFLGFPPEPQELRARNVGRVIVNTTTEKPWSQYFCCMVAAHTGFVRNHPVATKRALRAILKATDICAAEPELAARRLLDRGFTERYDFALQTLSEIPYAQWREFDAEDSLRFYALRLHEIGMIQSSPNTLLADHTDWRFLDELKRELKG